MLKSRQSICTNLLFPTAMHEHFNSSTYSPTFHYLTLVFASQMDKKYHFHISIFLKSQPQKHVIQA